MIEERKTIGLFGERGWLKNITVSKTNLMDQDDEAIKDYDPFMINRALGHFPDCIADAHMMNCLYHLDKDLQYEYLLHAIKPQARYSEAWGKNVKPSKELLMVAEYYECNIQHAEAYMRRLTEEQLTYIENVQGGRLKKKRGKK